MALPTVTRLDNLGSLDDELLYLFVAGPGEGEGLALALPGGGWLLVDGCRAVKQGADDSFPVHEIVERFGPGRVVEALVLTHPHRDHVWGIPELIETFKPRRVGTVGTTREGETLVAEVDAISKARPATTSANLRTSAVLHALTAIEEWCDPSQPEYGQLLSLHEGQQIPLDTNTVIVTARSPSLAWLRGEDLAELAVERANSLSVVLEVEFGRTRLVLGADMPEDDHGGRVPCGWSYMLGQRAELAYHTGLKVPHHGSREALHPDLIASYSQSRAWCVTPFNSSSLPKPDSDDGLDMLVRAESPIMLTSLSLSKKLQAASDEGRLTPPQVASALEAFRSGSTFQVGDTVWRAGTGTGPLDAVWCVAFDDRGNVVQRYRGAAALEVHRTPRMQ